MADSGEGFLRVHFTDESWSTISVTDTMTVSELNHLLSSKQKLQSVDTKDYHLFVIDSTENQECERCLDEDEFPLEIQEKARKYGRLSNFKFVYREAIDVDEDDDTESSGSDEDFFPQMPNLKSNYDHCDRCGYLEKMGQRNKSWRERWFVLEGDRLYYKKTVNDKKAISYIPLEDVIVREVPNTKSTEYVFEVNTKLRIYKLRAQDRDDMREWISALARPCEENELFDDAQRWIESVESAHADEDEKVIAKIDTLEGVLDHPNTLGWLLEFATDQHREEGLLFWLDCQAFLTAKGSLLQRGLDMYNKYLVPSAPLAVSIHSADKKKIKESIQTKTIAKKMFHEAQQNTFEHMRLTLFPDFKNSPYYHKALLNIPHPKKSKSLKPNKSLRDPKHRVLSRQCSFKKIPQLDARLDLMDALFVPTTSPTKENKNSPPDNMFAIHSPMLPSPLAFADRIPPPDLSRSQLANSTTPRIGAPDSSFLDVDDPIPEDDEIFGDAQIDWQNFLGSSSRSRWKKRDMFSPDSNSSSLRGSKGITVNTLNVAGMLSPPRTENGMGRREPPSPSQHRTFPPPSRTNIYTHQNKRHSASVSGIARNSPYKHRTPLQTTQVAGSVGGGSLAHQQFSSSHSSRSTNSDFSLSSDSFSKSRSPSREMSVANSITPPLSSSSSPSRKEDSSVHSSIDILAGISFSDDELPSDLDGHKSVPSSPSSKAVSPTSVPFIKLPLRKVKSSSKKSPKRVLSGRSGSLFSDGSLFSEDEDDILDPSRSTSLLSRSSSQTASPKLLASSQESPRRITPDSPRSVASSDSQRSISSPDGAGRLLLSDRDSPCRNVTDIPRGMMSSSPGMSSSKNSPRSRDNPRNRGTNSPRSRGTNSPQNRGTNSPRSSGTNSPRSRRTNSPRSRGTNSPRSRDVGTSQRAPGLQNSPRKIVKKIVEKTRKSISKKPKKKKSGDTERTDGEASKIRQPPPGKKLVKKRKSKVKKRLQKKRVIFCWLKSFGYLTLTCGTLTQKRDLGSLK